MERLTLSDSPSSLRKRLAPYAFALVTVIVAGTLRIAIGPVLGPRFPFAIFFMAIAFVARFWGFGPALFSVAAGTLGALVMLAMPFRDDRLSAPELWLGMTMYTTVGLIIAWLGGRMQDALAAAESHAQQLRRRSEELEAALSDKQIAERELRRTADALGSSEEFHRLISELTSDFSFRALLQDDGSLKIDYASNGFESVMGMSPQALNAAGGWSTAILPEDLQAVENTLSQVLTGRSVQSQARVQAADGNVRCLRYLTRPLQSEDGRVVGVIGAAEDVTEKVRIEEERSRLLNELEEKKALTDAVFEQAPVGIVLADAESARILSSNTTAQRIMRHRYEVGAELIGYASRHRFAASRPDGSEYAVNDLPLARAIRGATIEREVVIIDRPEDGRIIISANATPIRNASGEIIAAVNVFEDITEQRLAAERLQESQRFLRACLDSLGSHIAVIDEHGTILEVNEAWRRFASENGLLMDSFAVGANYLDELNRIQPGDHAESAEICGDGIAAKQGILAVIQGDSTYFEYEYPCHSPGVQRWFLMRVTRFQSPGPIRVVIAHENVTPLRMALDALRDADRRKDEFLATLAHELRNPLAPIKTALQLLAAGSPSAVDHDATRQMLERQVDHLVRLVDDLLDVSRVMRGRIELRKETIAVETIINRAVEIASPLVDAKLQELRIDIAPGTSRIEADPIRMTQVIGNLLTNAAKYTDTHGIIEIRAESVGDRVMLRIRDNGVGIEPQMLSTIFDLFVQIEQSSQQSQGGLGIGLTLVKNLVEMHGGSVEAKSDGLGRGTEFVVFLPACVPEQRTSSRTLLEQPTSVPVPILRRRLLIVDDNKDAAVSLATLLRIQGHDVAVAHAGAESIRLARTFKPELMLVDIGMPGMNGYDVARTVREDFALRETVLAALTGWGQESDRRRSTEAGFDFHLVKPLEPAMLRRLLEYLESRERDGAIT